MDTKKSTEIKAILGEEFDKFLGRLGIREDFEAGKYHCHVCGDQVRSDNILIVFPLSKDEVGFVCKKPECLVRYQSDAEE